MLFDRFLSKLQGRTDLKYELACDSVIFEAVDFRDVCYVL